MKLGKFNLISLIIFSFFSLSSWGAKVTKINKKKRLVWISEGKKDGLKKNKKVCFYKKSGKKVGCGKIKKLKSGKAAVKVSKKRIKKIKKGYLTTKPTDSSKVASSTQSKPLGILIGYTAGVLAPSTAKNIYFVGTTKIKKKTLWDEDPAASALALGKLNYVNLEVKFGFGLALGVNYGILPHQRYQGSDVTVSKEPLTTSNHATSNISAYGDFYFLNFSGLEVGGGVGFHMNKSELKVVDSGDFILISQKASMNVISVRLPIRYNYDLSPSMGLSLGLSVLIPVAGSPTFDTLESIKSPTTGVYDPAALEKQLGTTIAEDLSEAWGFKKNSFALNTGIKFYYNL